MAKAKPETVEGPRLPLEESRLPLEEYARSVRLAPEIAAAMALDSRNSDGKTASEWRAAVSEWLNRPSPGVK